MSNTNKSVKIKKIMVVVLTAAILVVTGIIGIYLATSVDSITLSNNHNSLYFVGDEIEIDDFKIVIGNKFFSDKKIQVTEEMLESPLPSTTSSGTHTITVTYNGINYSTFINVINDSIVTRSVEAAKVNYNWGDTFSTNDVKIKQVFTSGKIELIPVTVNMVTTYPNMRPQSLRYSSGGHPYGIPSPQVVVIEYDNMEFQYSILISAEPTNPSEINAKNDLIDNLKNFYDNYIGEDAIEEKFADLFLKVNFNLESVNLLSQIEFFDVNINLNDLFTGFDNELLTEYYKIALREIEKHVLDIDYSLLSSNTHNNQITITQYANIFRMMHAIQEKINDFNLANYIIDVFFDDITQIVENKKCLNSVEEEGYYLLKYTYILELINSEQSYSEQEQEDIDNLEEYAHFIYDNYTNLRLINSANNYSEKINLDAISVRLGELEVLLEDKYNLEFLQEKFDYTELILSVNNGIYNSTEGNEGILNYYIAKEDKVFNDILDCANDIVELIDSKNFENNEFSELKNLMENIANLKDNFSEALALIISEFLQINTDYNESVNEKTAFCEVKDICSNLIVSRLLNNEKAYLLQFLNEINDIITKHEDCSGEIGMNKTTYQILCLTIIVLIPEEDYLTENEEGVDIDLNDLFDDLFKADSNISINYNQTVSQLKSALANVGINTTQTETVVRTVKRIFENMIINSEFSEQNINQAIQISQETLGFIFLGISGSIDFNLLLDYMDFF